MKPQDVASILPLPPMKPQHLLQSLLLVYEALSGRHVASTAPAASMASAFELASTVLLWHAASIPPPLPPLNQKHKEREREREGDGDSPESDGFG